MKLLVTGANRGLGLSIAQEAVSKGHTVLAGVRNLNHGLEKLKQLKAEHADQIEFLQMDMINEDSISRAAAEVEKKSSSIDCIINNAAVLMGRDRQIDDIDLNELEQTFNINVFGAIRVIKHFLPLLYKGEGQSIINISSESGSITNAYGGDYSYSMSKTTLNMLSQQLHSHLKEKSIKVYAVHPGWMRTDMGGPQASTDPNVTAKGIVDIMERKPEVTGPYVFMDYLGKPMPI